jgi:alpha-L-rhamnosidase
MSKRLGLYLSAVLLLAGSGSNAQDIYQAERQHWLDKAKDNIPALIETVKKPSGIVSLTRDAGAFQGWKATPSIPLDAFYRHSFNKQKEVILDFGQHLTGYFSLTIDTLVRTPDAPLRFKLTFGEVPAEIATSYDQYNGGLSRAWLQDEVVTVMEVPAVIQVARRTAFRYVKIELIGSSPYYDFSITNAQCKAVTAAAQYPQALATATPSLIKDIDQVGLATLKECMQTVYEDGPKRDRRLWIGDLVLESLANNYSFRNFSLTRRCLYLLAGLSDPNGYLYGTVFETPVPHPQGRQFLMDYALLYNAALKEYLIASGDTQTAVDLWPVAKRQLDIIHTYLQTDGLLDYEKANKEWWLFFDWKNGLHKAAALQGLAIYALKNTYDLAKVLHKESEVKGIPVTISKMKKAARNYFFNTKTGLIESGDKKQVSYASQIWMTLGGVLTVKESQKALKAVLSDTAAVLPGTPYLYHYLVQAMVDAEMPGEARKSLEDYWGGMIKKGADTFWEVYDPGDDYLSPYGFFPINSYCHAWSCTPVYFIRKYPEIFQKTTVR